LGFAQKNFGDEPGLVINILLAVSEFVPDLSGSSIRSLLTSQ
jgi:hypothetical protein